MANPKTIVGGLTVKGAPLVGQGTATNNSAAAGFIGEHMTSNIVVGSAVALTTNTWADVTSISLTAGDWDVSGVVGFTELTTGAPTQTGYGVSDGVGATINGSGGDNFAFSTAIPTATGGGDSSGTMPVYRVSLSGSVTYNLKAFMKFAAGTYAAYGRISARRVR